jgi:hypothetical protein
METSGLDQVAADAFATTTDGTLVFLPDMTIRNPARDSIDLAESYCNAICHLIESISYFFFRKLFRDSIHLAI